ncbi:MAG: hypothetical protein M3O88_00155, partial [Actinomycetota bacterium]|nr:hypothetical protein [Actinomycetota bacterium]
EGFARLVNPEAGTVRWFDVGDADEVGGLLGRPMSSAALELLAASSRADRPNAAREFGVPPTSLDDGLRRTIERSVDLRLERWSS